MTWPVGTAVQAELDALRAECASLRAERDEAERDAARYRWLRHRIPVTAIHCRTESISMLPADQGEPTDEAYASEVDAAIDAAMEGGA